MSDGMPQFVQVAFPPVVDLPPDPDWPLGVYAQHCILTRFKKLLEQRGVVWQNTEHEGVHQIRVAARRCRTALVTFSELWEAGEARRFNKLLSRFASAFGNARDLDVMVEYIEQRRSAEPGEHPAYDWLLERNMSARDAEQPGLEETLTEFEDEETAREVVDFFSRHPYDLWDWEAADG